VYGFRAQRVEVQGVGCMVSGSDAMRWAAVYAAAAQMKKLLLRQVGG